ncbi:DUF4249 domain-containing protein [Persicobacter psychrovividus]|uniref:DUF4249 domain-containing protein n=1 Tax=Persicobacter psychrovividus TaxID=387638 RepID=A0ABN6L8E4_9BACT|nr:hypothetical protein PEPS_17350 [Persicobacter psychrovividus]
MGKVIQYLCGLLVVVFALTSCDKKIDLPLRVGDQRYVLEGNLNAGDTAYFTLSKSGAFNNPDIEKVIGAEITLTDEEGNSENLLDYNEGRYGGTNLHGKEGETYRVRVKHMGQVFNATATIPFKVKIDSLTIEDEEFTFPGEEPMKEVAIHYTDPKDVDNFYRVKVTVNGGDYNSIRLSNDKFYDGKQTEFRVRDLDLIPGDTIKIKLMSIDEGTHGFFNSLSEIRNQNPGSGVPYNPENNWDNNGLGNFSVSSTDSSYIVYQPDINQ